MQQREVLDPHDLALKVGAAVFGCLLFFKYFWCLEGFVFRCNSLLFLGLSGNYFPGRFLGPRGHEPALSLGWRLLFSVKFLGLFLAPAMCSFRQKYFGNGADLRFVKRGHCRSFG